MIATTINKSIWCGIGFLMLTLLFHWTDPYNSLFFSTHSLPNVLHNLGRLLFVGYLFLILFALGRIPFSLLARSGVNFGLTASEEMALSVLCGSAILRILMLALGFAGLYEWWLLAAAGTAACVFGWNQFALLYKQSAPRIQSLMTINKLEDFSRVLLLLALFSACTIVIVEKYFFPNGTGDYFSHYFPYYKYVTTVKNIWPNDIWYHFFISKSAGDVFFAIILSDLLGAAAVSCVMFFTGLLIMYCMMYRITNDKLAALTATCMTAIAFIFTYETTIGFTHWAEFPKQHVITAVLFFGGVFASWRQRSIAQQHWLAFACLTGLIFSGLILFRPQFAMIVLVFLAFMMTQAALTGERTALRAHLIAAIMAIIAVSIMLSINYAVTGLAEVTPFRFFWRYANQARFAEWVSPFMMLLLDLGSSADLGSIAPPDLHQFPFFQLMSAVFRLDRVSPFLYADGLPLLAITIMAGVALIKQPVSRQMLKQAAIFFLMLTAALLVFFSVNQIGSLYRLYMFCLYPVIAICVVLLAICRKYYGDTSKALLGLMAALLMLHAVQSEYRKIPDEQRRLEWKYARGKASIANAFASQNAVWDAALKMSAVAGSHTPIWSTQTGWHFCIAPACDLKTFFSYSMNKDWADIMFLPPTAARTALQQQGLNYFAFDSTTVAFDLLPYAPLFRPENIAQYLGLVWSQDGVYLLTWRSANTKPLPPEFIAGYRKSMQDALKHADFPMLYQRLASIYDKWKIDKQWPVHTDPTLPRVRGWQ